MDRTIEDEHKLGWHYLNLRSDCPLCKEPQEIARAMQAQRAEVDTWPGWVDR